MIKIDELREFYPIVAYGDSTGLTLQSAQSALEECAQSRGIPIAFYNDQVQSGGVFNRTLEDCIVLYHPEHQSDYYKLCIRVSYQGVAAFVSIMDFGVSKQMKKDAQRTAYKESRKGQPLSFKVGSLIGQAVTSIGRNQSALEEEQRYYTCLTAILNEVFPTDC